MGILLPMPLQISSSITYDTVLRNLADKFVPAKTLAVRRQSTAVWFDDESRQLRRHSRMLERRYRRTKTDADRRAWVAHERERHRVNRAKERGYWLLRINEHSGQPRKLWKTFSTMLGLDRVASNFTGTPSAQDLLKYFMDKVELIRHSTGSGPATTRLPPCSHNFSAFHDISEEARSQENNFINTGKIVLLGSDSNEHPARVPSGSDSFRHKHVPQIDVGRFLAGLTKKSYGYADSKEGWTGGGRRQELPADLQSNLHFEVD